jgi:L,D-transpeptidase ErfK/SrfK
VVGAVTDYVVKKGDTLRSIAARFGVDIGTLARENAFRSDRTLMAGESLRIDHRHLVPDALRSVDLVVNIPQRMLFYRRTDGATVGYPVAVGRPDWRTPGGPFTVTVLEPHPTWEVPRSILEESRRKGRSQRPVVPPGPDNPLGDFWIGLSLAGIGIHSTNVPSSIFGAVSHGCIRMHPSDIAQLFGDVRVGAAGVIVYEPVVLSASDDGVYLEVHRDVYRRATEPRDVARKLASANGVSDRVDWTLADAVVAAREGIARNVTRVPPRR